MFPDIDLSVLILIAFFAAVVNGGLGHGFSSITVPVAMLFYTNRILNPALVLVEVVINNYILLTSRKSVPVVWRRVVPIFLGLIPGIIGGAYLLSEVNPEWLKFFVCLILLPLILLQAGGFRRRIRSERAVGIPFGATVGVLYSVTTVSGPPLALMFNNQGFVKQEFRAALGLIRVAESTMTAAAYYFLGLYSWESARLLPAIVPSVLIGIPLGVVVISRIDPETFRRICMSFDAWVVGFGLSRITIDLGLIESPSAYGIWLAVIAIDAYLLVGFFGNRRRPLAIPVMEDVQRSREKRAAIEPRLRTLGLHQMGLAAPHGGRLVDRKIRGDQAGRLRERLRSLPRIDLTRERASEVMNIATGAFSPLEGYLGRADVDAVLETGRLANGVPWTIPIVLDVSAERVKALGDEVALCLDNEPLALLEVQEVFPLDREAHSRRVFGTTDAKHPGVARLNTLQPHLVAGPITMARDLPSPYEQYRLAPVETRTLFELKGWRTVVGFQTRNVPHIGHEYVQKSALTFVDGLFINPVIGRKKSGDFTDDAIIGAYEVLTAHYYPKQRSVLAVLETEMQYAGPREAIFHATVRKNFGCTHFIVGRDHAGVGNFYPPYAAHEIFDQYPDIGIIPLFFTAFFFCLRCNAVMNEKTCPHGREDHLDFSGSLLRNLGRSGGDVSQLVRREVAESIAGLADPFVP